jgi:hypothetical protein
MKTCHQRLAKQLIVAKSAAAVKEEKHKRNYLLISGIIITFLFIIHALNVSRTGRIQYIRLTLTVGGVHIQCTVPHFASSLLLLASLCSPRPSPCSPWPSPCSPWQSPCYPWPGTCSPQLSPCSPWPHLCSPLD